MWCSFRKMMNAVINSFDKDYLEKFYIQISTT